MLTVGESDYEVCGISVQYFCNFSKGLKLRNKSFFFFLIAISMCQPQERRFLELVTEEAMFCGLSFLP